MTPILQESDLPQELTAAQAVGAAYATELADAADSLGRGVPVLFECERDLTPFVYHNVRERLRPSDLQCLYLDGRPRPRDMEAGHASMIGLMLAHLREAVRGPLERRVVALPYLDVLTTGPAGLSAEAREVLPLLHENPEVVWLGFREPFFPLPRAVENLFGCRHSLLGVPRHRMPHLVTRAEARKLGRSLNLALLHAQVGGLNAVRLRRTLASLPGEDYPADPHHAWQYLRRASLTGGLEVPDVDLDRDVGGYAAVKRRLREELLDVLRCRNESADAGAAAELEDLIPRGVIFHGAGTGKMLFARALAGELGAALLLMPGPELKSPQFGGSEENVRQLFRRARQAAPALIVFDELDSFAGPRRGGDRAGAVEASMLAQLLAEMDRLPRDQLVFVAGTTRALDRLDPALLRPGRFELHLEIIYPDADDRRAILELYDRKFRLQMTAEALERGVIETAGQVPGGPAGLRYSGDHLFGLCRSLARLRARGQRHDATSSDDVQQALRVLSAVTAPGVGPE
jgi:cell division protease FtsH